MKNLFRLAMTVSVFLFLFALSACGSTKLPDGMYEAKDYYGQYRQSLRALSDEFTVKGNMIYVEDEGYFLDSANKYPGYVQIPAGAKNYQSYIDTTAERYYLFDDGYYPYSRYEFIYSFKFNIKNKYDFILSVNYNTKVMWSQRKISFNNIYVNSSALIDLNDNQKNEIFLTIEKKSDITFIIDGVEYKRINSDTSLSKIDNKMINAAKQKK
jgi:hypothetical protein